MSVRGATSCGGACAAPRGETEKIGGDVRGICHTPDASSTVLPGNDRYDPRANLAPTRSQTAAISLARVARRTQESDSQQDLYGGESRAVGAPGRERLLGSRSFRLQRETKRWRSLYKGRASVEREFGRLKNEYGLAPLRVRGLERVALQADLVMLARLSHALSRARATPLAT
jgi:hypothetical protein